MPVNGQVIELEQVEDMVFSGRMLGEGFAVIPHDGKVFSPVNGTVSAVFNTKHAIGFVSEGGAEVLVHIGLDTVKLGGKYFHVMVEPGMKVKVGDLVSEFDLNAIHEAGYLLTTPVVVSNSNDYTSVTINNTGLQKSGQQILTLNK